MNSPPQNAPPTRLLEPTDNLATRDPHAYFYWEKLRVLCFDSGTGPRTFAARLASEQQWTNAFTERAIEEYRRFLLLFALSQSPATAEPRATVQIVPSETVDKVWHLHLLFTHSYWTDLCQHILPTPLHHLPAEGADGEANSLHTIYLDTLSEYARIFGHRPPLDIWPRMDVARPVPPSPADAKPGSANSASASASASAPSGRHWLIGLLAVGFVALLFSIFDAEPAVAANRVFGLLIVGAMIAALVGGLRDGGQNRRRRGHGYGFSNGGSDFSFGGDSGGDGCSHHGGDQGGSHGCDGGHGGDGGGHGCSGGHGCGGGSCGGGGCGGGGCGGGGD